MMDRCSLSFVMAGLDLAIHVFRAEKTKTWTPGTSPGVTGIGEV